MQYFSDFGKILYQFGIESTSNVFQDISRYSDIIDQVKDDISFYSYYNIPEGFRSDHVSIQLYETPLYHWTLYLLNDNIRESGWPLTNHEIDVKIRKQYPDTVIVTRNDLTGKFKVGQTVTGQISGATGTIRHRDPNTGQLTINGSLIFSAGETVASEPDTGLETISITSYSEEYNAAHHYENADGSWADIDPTIGPGAGLTEVTNYEYYYNANEDLRKIKVIKPSVISSLVSSYKKSIRG
jgi:hypothetical protein